jgi:predicted MFS family arabinose efflux permease
MFVLGAVFLKFVGIKETANDVRFDSSWLKTSLRGFPEVYARKRLWSFLIALVVVVTAGGAINALIFPVLDQGLGLQPEALPVFTSLQGAAAVAAGLLGAALMRRFGFDRLMILGLVLFTLGYVAFAIPNVIAVLLASVALGFCMPIMAMVVMTIKQTELPMEVQGRSGAAMNMMLNGPQVLSSALVAVLIGITPYWVILIVGAVLSAFSLVPILRQRSRGEAAGTTGSSTI